ncbi:putative membrane protein [Bacteroides fragilis str. 3725 D9 ii]|nr:putative membrane protein [Bacteroides fragilis str. 3725 D9 ii]
MSEVHTGLSKKEEFVEWLALFALLSTPFLLLAYTILKMYVN